MKIPPQGIPVFRDDFRRTIRFAESVPRYDGSAPAVRRQAGCPDILDDIHPFFQKKRDPRSGAKSGENSDHGHFTAAKAVILLSLIDNSLSLR
jgi:hypothetical protein